MSDLLMNQLSFDNFFIQEPESNSWTNNLELFDAIPKFSYHRIRKNKNPEILTRSFKHRGQGFEIKLIPALIEDKEGNTWSCHSGRREELVLEALKYLAAQQLAPVSQTRTLIENSQHASSVSTNYVQVVFTLHQLRKELQRSGHGYKWSEINEALQILGRSVIKIKSDKYWSEGAIIESQLGVDDDEGKRKVVFHPLASYAIISDSTRLLRYDNLMSIKSPIASWIFKKLCHFVTNAQDPTMFKQGIGLKFTYEEVYQESGAQKLSAKKLDYRAIRNALKELKSKGILFNGEAEISPSWFEDLAKQEWIAIPSNKTVSDIITANKQNLKPQEKLQAMMETR